MGYAVKHMAIIAFSGSGAQLASRIKTQLENADFKSERGVPVKWKCSAAAGFGEKKVPYSEWVAQHFASSDALLFIGATGIAVRAIAPFLASKTTDPAVLVVDAEGSWCIPLLSGHLGGANFLANQVASITGATAVQTTATDVGKKWAVDIWAQRNCLRVMNSMAIKAVSSSVLESKPVTVFSPVEIEGSIPEGLELASNPENASIVIHVDANASNKETFNRVLPKNQLHLLAQTVVAGMGCRKETAFQLLDSALEDAFAQTGLSPLALREIRSIDIKENEPGLIELARKLHVPFIVHPASELECVEGSESSSEFVESTVGVNNVCERSALASDGALVFEKHIFERTTVALAKVEPKLSWQGESA